MKLLFGGPTPRPLEPISSLSDVNSRAPSALHSFVSEHSTDHPIYRLLSLQLLAVGSVGGGRGRVSARSILMHSYLTDEDLWPRKLHGQKSYPRDSCWLGCSILIRMGDRLSSLCPSRSETASSESRDWRRLITFKFSHPSSEAHFFG